MALTAAQKSNLLFKALMGKGSSSDALDFFEESQSSKGIIFPTQVWQQVASIPNTAPGVTAGVVQLFTDQVLTAIAGTSNRAYTHANLVDCIPFNFGDGTSYNYTLKDSTSAAIAFGQGDWVVDPAAGTLTFYGTVPGNMPPKITFYKYVGTKGVGTAGPPTTISGTAPVVYNSGTGAISMAAATDAVPGYLTAADHTQYTANTAAIATKEPIITAGTAAQYIKGTKTLGTFATDAQAAITATAPVVATAGVISMAASTDAVNGYMTAADHTSFTANVAHVAATTNVHGTGVGNSVVGTGTTQVLTNKDIDGSTATNTSRITLPKATKAVLDALTRKVGTTAYGTDTLKAYTDNGTTLDAVVSETVAAILTNKDIDGGTASNTSRFTIPSGTLSAITALARKAGTILYATDTQKFYSDNGTLLTAVGTGSGSGAINYVTNPDFETNSTGYAIYSDTAGITPVNAAGVAASTITFARSTTTPLRGTASGLITKTVANSQGQGVAYAFTIDTADKAKVLTISADYTVDSGTYADGDLTVYIYDVTNSLVIQPSGFQIKSVTTGNYGKISAAFQTSSNSTSYRVAFHVATPSALAYALKFDNISVGPQTNVQGAIITEWADFTPTGTWTTNTTYYGKWRRVGSQMEVRTRLILSGAPTSANLSVNLPSGYSIDSAKLPNNTGDIDVRIGYGDILRTGANRFILFVAVGTPTQVALIVSPDFTTGYISTNTVVTATVPSTFGTGDVIDFTYSVPISGWGAMANLGGADDARQVYASVRRATSSQSIATSATKVQFNLVLDDSHAAFDAVTNFRYTVATPGPYEFSGCLNYAAATAVLNSNLYLYKNGAVFKTSQIGVPNTTAFGHPFTFRDDTAKAGDYYEIYALTSTASTLLSDGTIVGGSFLDIKKLSGSATIAAAESVNAKYTTTSFSGATGIVILTGKAGDSHNGYNTSTGVYTFPAPGTYDVTGLVQSAAVSFAVGGFFEAYVSVNGAGAVGTNLLGGNRIESTSAINRYAGGNTLLYNIKAGDTASLYLNSSTSNALVLAIMNIKKVGN